MLWQLRTTLDGDTIELLMVDYGIEATKKEERYAGSNVFADEDYLYVMVERAPVVTIMDTLTMVSFDTLRNSRGAGLRSWWYHCYCAYQIERRVVRKFWTRGLYIYACPWCFCYRYYYLDCSVDAWWVLGATNTSHIHLLSCWCSNHYD